MKRINWFSFLLSALILMSACFVGSSAEGINLDELIPTTTKEETTVQSDTSDDTLTQVDSFLQELGVGYQITEIIIYMQQGNSFADWVEEKYGDSVDIPESIREMSTAELVLYLMGSALDTETTTESSGDSYISLFPEDESDDDSQSSDDGISTTVNTEETTVIKNDLNAGLYTTGDVNSDGKITSLDARLVLRAASKLESLSAVEASAADVNGDGVITAKDARSILRYSAKLTTGF